MCLPDNWLKLLKMCSDQRSIFPVRIAGKENLCRKALANSVKGFQAFNKRLQNIGSL